MSYSTTQFAVTAQGDQYKFLFTDGRVFYTNRAEASFTLQTGTTFVEVEDSTGIHTVNFRLCTSPSAVTFAAWVDAVLALGGSSVIGSVTQGTTPWRILETIPATSDIIVGSRSTNGTLVTIPAGRTFTGSLALSGSIAEAGTCHPSISLTGTGIAPSAGTIFRIAAIGLASVSVANANTMDDVYIYGGTTGATVTFTSGDQGFSIGQISGRLL